MSDVGVAVPILGDVWHQCDRCKKAIKVEVDLMHDPGNEGFLVRISCPACETFCLRMLEATTYEFQGGFLDGRKRTVFEWSDDDLVFAPMVGSILAFPNWESRMTAEYDVVEQLRRDGDGDGYVLLRFRGEQPMDANVDFD